MIKRNRTKINFIDPENIEPFRELIVIDDFNKIFKV